MRYSAIQVTWKQVKENFLFQIKLKLLQEV